jgi:hypothetical protein
MSNSRIPEEFNPFTIYLDSVRKHLCKSEPPPSLLKRGQTLGMTSDEVDDLVDKDKEWFTGDPLNPGLWDLHKEESTKNKVTRRNCLNFMKEFRAWFGPLLDIIEVSRNITSEDRLKLNIAEPSTGHSEPGKITAKCYSTPIQLGGGVVKIVNAEASDQSRPSVPENADGFEIRYIIIDTPKQDTVAKSEGEPEGAGSIKGVIINDISQCTDKDQFSGSSHELDCGHANKGRNIQYFVRWIHSKHPENAGKWSDVYSTLIL